jgi:hypothetical protein
LVSSAAVKWPALLTQVSRGVGGHPLSERSRLVNLEDAAAARIGVEEVRELRDRSGGEVEER